MLDRLIYLIERCGEMVSEMDRRHAAGFSRRPLSSSSSETRNSFALQPILAITDVYFDSKHYICRYLKLYFASAEVMSQRRLYSFSPDCWYVRCRSNHNVFRRSFDRDVA